MSRFWLRLAAVPVMAAVGVGVYWAWLAPPAFVPSAPNGPGETSSALTPATSFYDRLEVLSIGVNTYATPWFNPLSQPETEAGAFGKLMREQYGSSQPRLLCGSQATKAAIDKELEELDSSLKPGDSLIIYFSGHGHVFDTTTKEDPIPRRVGFLVPHDAQIVSKDTTDLLTWDREAISMSSLVERIGRMKAKHVLLIADCCYSGFMTTKNVDYTTSHVELLGRSSRCVMASSTHQERSQDGVFSGVMWNELTRRAKDRAVFGALDLFLHIRDEVPKKVKTDERDGKKGTQMLPQFARVGEGTGEFIFVPTSMGREKIDQLRQAVNLAERQQPPGDELLAPVRGVLQRRQAVAGERISLADVIKALEAAPSVGASNAADEKAVWLKLRESFEKNARLSDPLALAGLHLCLAKGLGTADGVADPAGAYRAAVQADSLEGKGGNGVGRYLLGLCYQQGLSVPKNPRTAEILFEQSAGRGFLLGKLARASTLLARTTGGREVQPLTGAVAEEFIKITDEGIRSGVPQALELRADALAGGLVTGVKRDRREALAMLRAGAGLGSPRLKFRAAVWLAGIVPGSPTTDTELAARYLEEAAAAGHLRAMYWLGVELYRPSFEQGYLNLKPDTARGKDLLVQSASLYDPAACCVLARLYSTGDGAAFQPNAVLAKKYTDVVTQANYPATVPPIAYRFQLTAAEADDTWFPPSRTD